MSSLPYAAGRPHSSSERRSGLRYVRPLSSKPHGSSASPPNGPAWSEYPSSICSPARRLGSRPRKRRGADRRSGARHRLLCRQQSRRARNGDRGTLPGPQTFFALPDDVKGEIPIERSPHYLGYARMALEKLDPNRPGDAKESFNMGREHNQWPRLRVSARASLRTSTVCSWSAH